MALLGILALFALIGIIGYGGMIAIKKRREDMEVKSLLKDWVSDTAGQPASFVRAYRNKLEKKAKKKAESYKKIEKLLSIDAYQSLYYKKPQWLTILISGLIAIGILGFYKFCFDYKTSLFFLLFPPLTIFVARKSFESANRKRKLKLFEQLPENLDVIIRAMKVGVPPNDSIKTAARDAPEPSRTEFSKLYSDISVAMKTPTEAFMAMAERNQIPEYKFLAIAISLQTSTGGSISGTLESVVSVIKSRLNIRDRGKALTGEARASVGVLTYIPVFTVSAMAFTAPAYIYKLFDTESGRFWLGVATTLIVFGQYVVRNMLKKVMEDIK